MKSGPISSGRSSRNRDFGRGATAVIAVMSLWFPRSRVLSLAPVPVEIAQLRLAHGEDAFHAGRNAAKRRVCRQLGGHFALGGSAVERAVEDVLGAQILHARDAKRELDHGSAVEQILGQEVLGTKAERPAVALD